MKRGISQNYGQIYILFFCIFFFSPEDSFAQLVETESGAWVTTGLGPYPSSSWTVTTGGSPAASGRTPGTTSGRLLWITAADAGITSGTYHIDVRWYDNHTETGSQLYLQVGSRSCSGSNFSVCHSGIFAADDEWSADLPSPGFSTRSYPSATIAATDTIFYYIDLSGNSTNAWIDYIQFTPSLPNANPPILSNQFFNIDENSTAGTLAGTVAASDPDAGQSVTSYSITAGNTGGVLSIDNSGQITANGSLDFETTSSYPLTVEACDNGTPVYCSSATVTITINDVFEAPNNNDPVITNAGTVRSISENSNYGTAAGVPVSATDADGNSVTFSISGGNTGNAFYINSSTGQLYVNSLLDYEMLSSYSLSITATDNGFPARTTTSVVIINITDVSETATTMSVWHGPCAGTTVPIVANPVGATFAGWERSGGGTTDITRPSSASTTVTNHTSPVTYIARAVVPTGSNLVTNGDFEAGNTVTGFYSSYSYRSTSVTAPGQFGLTQNADDDQSYFVSSPNRTPGGSWYLYADGANASGAVVYETTVSVTSGLSYSFSAWFANGHDGTVNNNETAHLEFRVSGMYTGDIFLPLDVGVWHPFTSAFTATSTGPITISIVNRNTNSAKNDFFLDDIVFQQATLITETLTVPACPDPLPVEWTDFTGVQRNDVHLLSWSTASEKNNLYFIIERSSNGTDFFPIGSVQGKGNSGDEQEYLFKDTAPLNGTNYYRLKQVDFNGLYSYSKIISLKNNEEEITVYPNPSSGSFKVIIHSMEKYYRLDIMDVEGRMVYTDSGEITSSEIDVNNLSSGMYIARFYLTDRVAVKKVVVL